MYQILSVKFEQGIKPGFRFWGHSMKQETFMNKKYIKIQKLNQYMKIYIGILLIKCK